MSRVAIGLVGYYQFVRGYPLGPELKERLETVAWPEGAVAIKEMNWGPIAIVQDFQANPVVYDRIVLVGAVDRGLETGTVTCRQWVGGKLDVMAVQDRVFEAVTGIISLDNLLVIGEHFGIWPRELIVIEVQLPDNSIGNLILDELEVNHEAGEVSIVGQYPLKPGVEKIVERTVDLTREAVIQGVTGMPGLVPLSVDQLNPLAEVCHNQLIEDCGRQSPSH